LNLAGIREKFLDPSALSSAAERERDLLLSLTSKLDGKQAERDLLSRELALARKKLDSLQTSLSAKQKRISELTPALQQLEFRLVAQQQDEQKERSRLTSLREQIEDAKAKRSAVQRDTQVYVHVLSQMHAEKARAGKVLETKQMHEEELKRQVAIHDKAVLANEHALAEERNVLDALRRKIQTDQAALRDRLGAMIMSVGKDIEQEEKRLAGAATARKRLHSKGHFTAGTGSMSPASMLDRALIVAPTPAPAASDST